LQKVLEGSKLLIGDKLLHKTEIVYTGITINSITDLDVNSGTYEVEFYLWFRYKKSDMDPTNIQFIDAVNPVRITPIALPPTEKDWIVVKAFEVKVKFNSKFDFHNFPLEYQKLKISFRHAQLTRDNLIYVVDTRGMPKGLKKENEGTKDINTNTGWYVKDRLFYQDVGWYVKERYFYQDVVSNASSLGMPEFFDTANTISYSQFNGVIRIARQGLDAIWRYFGPVALIVFILFIINFISYERNTIRIGIIMALLFTNAVYHIYLLKTLPVEYMTLLEWVYIAIYIFICLTLLALVIIFMLQRKIHRLQQEIHPLGCLPPENNSTTDKNGMTALTQKLKNAELTLKMVNLAGKFIWPLLILVSAVMVANYYGNN
jgi:branched-chain amino acid transport system substrate-binding protein